MDISNLKPINTVFSVDSILEIDELIEAKLLMNKEYGNKYTHIPPHLAYTIIPFPEKNFEQGKKDLIEYIKKKKQFTVHISDFDYEEKENFFYVSLRGEMITKHNKNLTNMINK